MIAQQSGQNCAARAFSTMRLALGYTVAVPEKLESDGGGKYPYQILQSIKDWFPNHDVSVFCAEEQAEIASDKSAYAGSCFDMDDTAVDGYIIAFSYYTTNSALSHIVVGAPMFYEGMHTSIIVCVKQ